MKDTKVISRKLELEKQLGSFLSHATIEVLRDRLYKQYNVSNSFLQPDVYQISCELDLILVEEQRKLLEEYLETVGEADEEYQRHW